MKIKPLIWDSDFLNKNVGEVYIDEFENININNANNFDLIYVKSKANKPFNIKGFGNTFSENKVTFSKPIQDSKKQLSSFIKSVFEIDYNINQLYELALESGKYSRFKLDKNFSIETFEAFFKLWIDNSLNKEFSDDVLVYFEENQIYGFVTYKVDSDIAIVGLFGVNKIAQGKGLGTKLLQKLESKLSNKGVVKINIPTQLENTQACKFYSKLGYTIEEDVVIKHYWKL